MVVRKIHRLKCIPPYFQHICDGVKTFELRKDDRDYQVGDILFLQEYNGTDNNMGYTTREIERLVLYKMNGGKMPGLERGFCILGIGMLPHKDENSECVPIAFCAKEK